MLELNRCYCMDAVAGLKQLDAGSMNCIVTSPPYYGLRDYGIAGQIGLESTPEAYISRLVGVIREVWRVLRDDGTLWLNMGDSYAANRTYQVPDTHVSGSRSAGIGSKVPNGMKPKDLMGIPWMLAFALRADGWYLRQDIVWSKPNPMPESVRDRCTKSHEYIFLFSKSPHYYFDAEAIAEPVAESTVARLGQDVQNQAGSQRVPGKSNGPMKAVPPRYGGKKYTEDPDTFYRTKSGNAYELHEKRNKRDVWTVATQPFKEAHFATFPPELIKPCILAGCPEGGTVCDPFMGSGTTGEVSARMFRNFIGFDLNPDYCDMANNRAEPILAQLHF